MRTALPVRRLDARRAGGGRSARMRAHVRRTYVRTCVRRLFLSEAGDQPGPPKRSYVSACVALPKTSLSPSSLALPIIVIVVVIVINAPPSPPSLSPSSLAFPSSPAPPPSPHRCQAISQVAACVLPERLRDLFFLMHFLSCTYVRRLSIYPPGGPPGAHPHWERSGATWTNNFGPKSWAPARFPSKRRRSLRLRTYVDVAPQTSRPGPRGAVVTDITKRPRFCDPLMFVRTSRRAPPSWRSQMCPTCLGSVTCEFCFYLTKSQTMLRAQVCASPRLPSPPRRLGATRDVDTYG